MVGSPPRYNKYGSRKWIIASFVEVAATLVMIVVLWWIREKPELFLQILVWWGGVSAGVIGLYSTADVVGTRLNKEDGGSA